ncbi:MAG: SDR family NAD(P)-dependent oxidoreductase [Terriglobia bacterium]|jgi:NAD(P)-dependent dehydrogenase (short-subunit alcohol dehydrogenase family)|nr:SDR family NAD(P)-dependent oxidoreductase [Terriglobia bacterium]
MKGKIVLITGANGGLGMAVTNAFLDAGATVVGVSRSIRHGDFASPNFAAYPADITQSQAARDLIAQVVGKYRRIDVLVHVTGGFAAARIDETDDVTWTKMRDLNLSSAFYIAREVIKAMRKSGGGRLIAIGSLAAVEPHASLGAYATFKSALTMLYRTIALENQDKNISANVILPGTMDTQANRTAMPDADPSKWVQPADVAKVALLLAGVEGSRINGALIPVSR